MNNSLFAVSQVIKKAGYTLVCASGTDMQQLAEINAACRAAAVPFLAIGSAGCSAYAFMDYLDHEYDEVRVVKEVDKVVNGEKIYKEVESKDKKTLKYVSLLSSLGTSWFHMPPTRLYHVDFAAHLSN